MRADVFRVTRSGAVAVFIFEWFAERRATMFRTAVIAFHHS